MKSVTVRNLENLQQLVITSSHALTADGPEDEGDDLEPSPYELLLTALGTCTAKTILLYVRRKEWPLDSVTVECSRSVVYQTSPAGSLDRKRIEKINYHVLLKGDLTDEQLNRIKYIARRCPVHRTLESPMQIEDKVEVVGNADLE